MDKAIDFARRAMPTATMTRVLYEVSLEGHSYDTVVMPHPGLPYGPAVPVEYIAKFHGEKEVLLLDGTVLKVAKQDDIEGAGYGFECVRIKAEVDWDELDGYFHLCHQASEMVPA
jgi:hypothetical protein